MLLTCCLARSHFRPSSCEKRPKINQKETNISNTKLRKYERSGNDEAPSGQTPAQLCDFKVVLELKKPSTTLLSRRALLLF